MPFGLTNSPIDLINRVIKNYLDSFVLVSINDILVYTKNEDDYIDHLRVVFQVLKEHQIFDKYSKCEFLFRWFVFLFHII